MEDQSYYRSQSERCRRLARLLPNDEVVGRLLALAAEYDMKAVSAGSRGAAAGGATVRH
jgi:hypothetical protein